MKLSEVARVKLVRAEIKARMMGKAVGDRCSFVQVAPVLKQKLPRGNKEKYDAIADLADAALQSAGWRM